MKTCSKCGDDKPLSEYYKDRSTKDGYKASCKTCNKLVRTREGAPKAKYYKREDRWRRIFKNYGITEENYNRMVIEQNNKCAICNLEEIERYFTGEIRHLCVDHCHEIGTVRGLLCSKCNQAIGLLKDSITLLSNAIEYLKK